MPSNTTSLLNFALQQMAAESYLQGIEWNSPLQVRPRLLLGNNNVPGVDPTEATLAGNTRFTGALVERFLKQYDILDHHANDATGFSATLMRDKTTGEYTLSFRSTEAKHQADGGDWERDGLSGADGEIAQTGFALAQLVSMEKYYRSLKADPSKLPAGAVLNVTGYSLGGHLATVFTELHANEVQAAFTFNGAGRGRINGGSAGLPEGERIRQMLEVAETQLDAIDPSWFNSGNMVNVYTDQRYLDVWQSIVRSFHTTRSLSPPGEIGTGPGFDRITQLVGLATHNDGVIVANPGIHGRPTTIFIEDQPNVEGFSMGLTHSITLIVDSLALNELFQSIDGSLQRSVVEEIFAASSSQSASGFVGMSGVAEGNSLEQALDALGGILVPNYTPTLFGRGAYDFGNLTFRNSFYDNIQAVKAAVGTEKYQIVSVATKSSSEIFAVARQDDASGLAYRYALRELNPFIVTGVDYLTVHNQDHSLDLYDGRTGAGVWTQMALSDRAELLVEKFRFNQANGSPVSQTLFVDEATFFYNLRGATATETVIFGDAEGREYVGRRGADHIYGGAGEDTIRGAEGQDYLEGGDGNDTLFGEAHKDTLVGQQGEDFLDGGRGADRLTGGVGDDRYIVDDPGDQVVEFEGGGTDQVQADVSFALSTNVERLILTGSDNIAGTGNDLDNRIIGNSGNNKLAGGRGNDLLEGGIGFDTYIYNAGDGLDRIEDSDAQGQIIFDGHLLQGGIRRAGDATNTYTSLDGKTTYAMSGTDLIVNGILIVNENFQSGQMGIELRDVSEMPHDAGAPTGFFKDTYIGNADGVEYTPGSGATEIYANGGDDTLFGDHVPILGAFNDLLDGGIGNDVFWGGFGEDYLIGGPGDDYAFMTERDMFLGGDGDDYAVGLADYWDLRGLRIDGGAHYANGGAGSDTLMGEMGADVLVGGDGNDVLRGENRPAGWISLYYDNFTWNRSPQPAMISFSGADDYLDGGAGNDLLVGDGGNDIVLGGAGEDRLYGESDFTQTFPGDDWLDGGEGNDQLFGGAGVDSLSGGDGDDLLVGDFSEDPGAEDVLDGGAGADELQGGGGDDILYGGSGMDRLGGFGGDDFLDGGADNDELQGGLGDDALFGGVGHDRMIGQEGDDTLFGDEGDDELDGSVGSDLLFGGADNDSLFGQDGQDLLSGEAGDDLLNGGAGNDELDGGDGIDDMQGREGDDVLVGGTGNDFLYGDGNNPTVLSITGGHDTLDGEDGDDQLWAGAGEDQLFGGDGHDQLVGDVGDDHLYGGSGDDVLFGDTPLFVAEAGADVLDGGDGNDVLQGGGGDDDLHGGVGDDRLIGGGGLDTYRFNLGDGIDSIEDNAVQANILMFGAGITLDSLSLDVAPADTLVLRVRNDDAVHITGFGLNAPPEFYTIRQIEFADGTGVTVGELLARGFQLSSPATGGSLQGTSFADHIQGSQVGDWLYGRGGNDVVVGGLGDDVLTGEEGDDELDGGAGNDRLYGNEGHNLLRGGEGNDILHAGGPGDQLSGGAGDDAYHLWSMNGHVITEETNAGQDTVYLTSNESLTFQAPINVENVRIEDDVPLDPTIQVNLVGNALDNELSGSHRLDGQAGNDTLIGTGDNTFVFGPGYGQDVVRMGMQMYARSGLDQVQFLAGVTPANLSFEGQANDLVAKVTGTADELRLKSYFESPANKVDQFIFSDGTIWTSEEIDARVRTRIGIEADESFYGSTGDDTIRGMGGNDQIRADVGNDVLDGGTGNDFLEGFSGNDVYVFGRGYGQDSIDEQGDSDDLDILQLIDGITPGDITLQATPDFGTTALLTIKNTADQVALGGFFFYEGARVDQIQFSDGTIWDYSAMLARVEGVNLVGTEDTDYYYGNVTNDVLFGLGGDDTLSGGAGNDTLDGGSGADYMTGGTGNDVYVVDDIDDMVTEQGGQGTDTVQSSRSYLLGANLENLTLTGSAAINGTGNSLNNILVGNSATNLLAGGAGNDTYIVGFADTVVEAASAGTDTVKSDMSWTLGANVEQLVLTGVAAVNGTGNSLANTITGNSAGNILSGESGADTLIGAQGDDLYIVDNVGDRVTELTGEGLDTIQSSVTYTLGANVENLTLNGTSAINGTGNGLDNVLVGNSAANRLTGGAGHDTYVVGAGDTIVEGTNAGIDTVQSSVTHTLAANVENLTLLGTGAINGTGNGLNNILVGNNAVNTLAGGAGDDTYVVGAGDTVVEAANAGIDTVQSSATWTLGANVENLSLSGVAAINGTGNTLANVVTGNAGNNILTGGDGNDTLSGGKGNDALNGGTGSDVFQLTRGDGQDTIIDASGTGDRLSYATGINPLDLILSQSANDLRIAVYGSTDRVTIANWYAGAANQIETVQAGNGQQLMSTQVNQLIQAMAGFTQHTGLSWDQAVAQRPQDVQQILAANWQ